MIDFDALTPEEIDALDGYQREAWYSHQRGDHAKAREIVATYETGDGRPRSEKARTKPTAKRPSKPAPATEPSSED